MCVFKVMLGDMFSGIRSGQKCKTGTCMLLRWLVILVVFLCLATLSAFSVLQELSLLNEYAELCVKYVGTLNETWSLRGDPYYWSVCDRENSSSLLSFEARRREHYTNRLRIISVTIIVLGSATLALSVMIARSKCGR